MEIGLFHSEGAHLSPPSEEEEEEGTLIAPIRAAAVTREKEREREKNYQRDQFPDLTLTFDVSDNVKLFRCKRHLVIAGAFSFRERDEIT